MMMMVRMLRDHGGGDGDEQSAAVADDTFSLTKTQHSIIIGLSMLASTLSVFGSCSIMYLVLKTKKLGELYHRLVFGLSTLDALLSMYILIINTVEVLLVAGTIPGIDMSAGCNSAAFMRQLFLGVAIYNAELSFYFLMAVRNCPETTLKRRMEPTVHILPFAVPLAFGCVHLR